MKLKKMTAVFTAAAIAFLPAGQVFAEVPQEISQEQMQYVLVAENETVYEEVAQEISDSITVETPVLSENNIMVAELDEKEAKELEENDGIIIEEDFILTASTAEDGNAARMSKEEVKRLKEKWEAEEEEARKAAQEAEPEYEWNIQAVDAEEAAEQESVGKERAKVAVLDSGVDYVSGINLTGYANLVEEEDYLSEMFQDLTGHGTGIAGIISGNGESGVYGVNPNAELYSVRVLDKDNKAPLSRIIRGIYWCIENGMNIINMSFGTPNYSKALESAVKDAYEAGILMVAAAGNDGGDVEYPAAFDEVMAVAATDTKAQLSEFSNTGDELEIAAPGEKICTTGYFGGCVVTHGTSIAVPHVTGAASLLWEKDLGKSNTFIRRLLEQSAKDIKGTDECGLLDVAYALESYDSFAADYQEDGQISDGTVPENPEEPEQFEYVDEDESYVEGRWGGHAAILDFGFQDTGISFNSYQIQWLKDGIIYPDQQWRADKGEKLPKHQPWHGIWMYKSKYGYRVNEFINYAAVVELVTSIALKAGDTSSFTDYKAIPGIDEQLFKNLRATIRNWYTSASGWSAENRKFFLYGCGLHVLTDLFSHSSATEKNEIIKHSETGNGADTIGYYPGRYQAAQKAVSKALRSLHSGAYSDGYEILYGLKYTYRSSNSVYHLIDLKKNVNANGYDDMYVDLVNLVNVNNANVK